MARLLSFPTFLATGFLVGLLYVRSTGELQPIFLISTVILAGTAACYLWKRVVRTSLFSYAAHVAALGFIWALYWLFRDELLVNPATSTWMPIALFVCMAFCTFFLSMRLCRRISSTRKWAATLLVLYPASMITLTPSITEKPDQDTYAFYFGSVVAKIQFNGIAPLPYETYRYYTSTRMVSISKAVTIGDTLYTDLKLQSVYLRVNAKRRKPESSLLEVIRKNGHVQYFAPRIVHFDGVPLESEGEIIDGQLVVISHDSHPYDWEVFYLLPSAYQTLKFNRDRTLERQNKG